MLLIEVPPSCLVSCFSGVGNPVGCHSGSPAPFLSDKTKCFQPFVMVLALVLCRSRKCFNILFIQKSFVVIYSSVGFWHEASLGAQTDLALRVSPRRPIHQDYSCTPSCLAHHSRVLIQLNTFFHEKDKTTFLQRESEDSEGTLLILSQWLFFNFMCVFSLVLDCTATWLFQLIELFCPGKFI